MDKILQDKDAIVTIAAIAPSDDQADQDKPQAVKVTGVAYSGGIIRQVDAEGRGYDLVVDLSGMEFAPQIPLMNTHDYSLFGKVGEVKPKIVDAKLLIEGELMPDSFLSEIIADRGRISKWQLSVGAQIQERRELEPGKQETINGHRVKGPLTIATKTILREISVVAIGADKDTQMTIAASLRLDDGITTPKNGDQKMTKAKGADLTAQNPLSAEPKDIDVQATSPADVNPNTPNTTEPTHSDMQQVALDAVQAERRRVAEITAICGTDCQAIAQEAIAAGWDIPKVTAKCLEAIRKRPTTGVNVVIPNRPEINAKVLECALALRCGCTDAELKAYDEPTLEAGNKAMDITLKDLCREVVRIDGGTSSGVGFDNTAIKAAFSSVSLPGILSNVANKIALKYFNSTPVLAFRFCSVGNLNDFKESDRFRLTDVGDLLPVGADGEIKEGGLKEESAKNQLETYGKKFCLTRKMIINDDLGLFMQVPKAMGNRAARKIDQLFFSRLTANPIWLDGKSLFHEDHGNLIAESGELSAATLKQAIELFLDQVDADGQPINLEPATLLVPTAYKFAAEELINSVALAVSGNTDRVVPTLNILSKQGLTAVSTNYLKGKDWYLFGNPNECDTFEIGFLKGKRTPTVEQGETDFNTLGMWFRVYFDLGVREQDTRGMVKSQEE